MSPLLGKSEREAIQRYIHKDETEAVYPYTYSNIARGAGGGAKE